SIAHIVASSRSGYEAQRFDLRFFRPFRADLSIRKSSSFLPPLIAARSQRGFAPRPAQVSPKGPRYFGGTFFPRNALPPPRTTLPPPTKATALSSRNFCLRMDGAHPQARKKLPRMRATGGPLPCQSGQNGRASRPCRSFRRTE